MASAFWTLEDGRGFARRWSGMSYMLKLITDELRSIEGAEEFYDYLKILVYQEGNGDQENGYGGFIRDNENIMINFDLRTFTPTNRKIFWNATQKALNKLKVQENESNEGIIFLLSTLLDMHKRIKRGEDPMELNHLRIIESDPKEKLGPGWEEKASDY